MAMNMYRSDFYYPTFEPQDMFFAEVKEVLEEKGLKMKDLVKKCGNPRIPGASRGEHGMSTQQLERIAYELDKKLVICLLDK